MMISVLTLFQPYLQGRGVLPGAIQKSVSDFQRGSNCTPQLKARSAPGSMIADVAVSLSVLAVVVLLSDVTRRLLVRGLADTGLSSYAVELVSTFQLCCCTHELKLLSEVGGIPPQLALTLTYVTSVAHGLTFRGAVGNPCGALEHAYRARFSGGCAVRRIACQFAAAVAARVAVPVMWDMGLSGMHDRHKLLGFRCVSAIHATLPEAAAVELMCAFAVQTVITHTQSVEERYRVHAIAAAITTAVYAGRLIIFPFLPSHGASLFNVIIVHTSTLDHLSTFSLLSLELDQV
ncbi:hypothetical protein GOODEAATRI_022743 [Goodea atripinnis]|uniref:Aquaporin n=1 Tax=Goodea atripinnis TaxID=208336 RepID=A0ABV0N4Z7_9TELE